MTSALWGVLEMMTHDDRGEGGVKNCQNGGDVICGCPLMCLRNATFSNGTPYEILGVLSGVSK